MLIASFLGIIASRPFFEPMPAVQAQAARFDHVTILATTFVYKGRPGLLLSDRRIIIRLQAAFAGPVELTMWLDEAGAGDSDE